MGAYTPGLLVTSRCTVKRRRELPLPGKAEVAVGARVKAADTVLAAELPGDIVVLRVADRMEMEPEDVIGGITVKDGDEVTRGQLLCETKTFFGLFSTVLKSPVTGIVEFFTEVNAHLGIRKPPTPLTVTAYIDGVIEEIEAGKAVTISTEASLIQGIFGVGGERQGTILALNVATDEVVTVETLSSLDLTGKIVIGGTQFSEAALAYAGEHGAAAVVTGSIDAETLRNYVGYEIGVSITGDEEVPCTVIVTEGFGALPLSTRIAELAKTLDGRTASVNGATQVRAGAMRPEIICPLPDESIGDADAGDTLGNLAIGSRIRVIRVPYFGGFGEVVELPKEPEQVASGARVRVLRAKLENGDVVTVPRANVELA